MENKKLFDHPDRTTKQPLTWFCINPQCADRGKRHEWEGSKPVCPKCSSEGPPCVQLRTLIHLLLPEPKGLIPGQYGRYRIACDATRDYLATNTNNEQATGDVNIVNCPGCLKAAGHSGIVDVLGRSIQAEKE